jgi:hypothetical protein
MTKTVLLARPHPFIAAEMRSFRILGLDSLQSGAGHLGRPDTLLYLSKDGLTSVARRSAAARLIQRHFL